MFVYIHPENSPAYDGEENSGIDNLERQLLHIIHDYGNLCRFILCGDFNARTGQGLDYLVDDGIDYLPIENEYTEDDFCLPRDVIDFNSNNYGRALLELCKLLGVHLVNGRTSSDFPANFTFISHTGSSTVDYYVVSSCIFESITDMSVVERTEWDHLPIVCHFKDLTPCAVPQNNNVSSTVGISKCC